MSKHNVPNPSTDGQGANASVRDQPNQTAGGNTAPTTSPVSGPGAVDQSVAAYKTPPTGPTNKGNVLPTPSVRDMRRC